MHYKIAIACIFLMQDVADRDPAGQGIAIMEQVEGPVSLRAARASQRPESA